MSYLYLEIVKKVAIRKRSQAAKLSMQGNIHATVKYPKSPSLFRTERGLRGGCWVQLENGKLEGMHQPFALV
ncbi:uncharacterized protein SPSK_00642 [Sporothrix schenckii 1099-18]|uniref:Uncharacterized protein n=1 Tax=Sporothrix schenckii 1099-18 TaxID=1397361 RepID=A0A0F2LT33_SPOSC|nr:uncharacterized protein SPSK_00642 [Sporothrix schenckii 1099-18]KJR80014.1 hypothetical protein SPSK_00642 [Sporothrix schenckii 1099-18]